MNSASSTPPPDPVFVLIERLRVHECFACREGTSDDYWRELFGRSADALEALRADFERYGCHLVTCLAREPCTCGYEEARKRWLAK
jgi:hypothetical protein